MIKVENVDVYGFEAAIIPDFPEYKVTKDGQVIGKRGKPMKGHVDRCGYREVMLSYYPHYQKQILVHRLVLKTFNPIENMEELDVNHIDGNKLNNSLDNLEWCTRSENIKHAYEIGLEKKQLGEKHHAHKLTNEDVIFIRTYYKKRDNVFGATPLSKRFNVDRTTIHDIISRKTWKEVCI